MWYSALSLCEGDLAKRSTTRVAYLKWRISTLTMSFCPPVFRRHWLPSQASTMPPRASARPPPPRCSLICFPEPTKATDIPRCDFISGHWNERSRRMEQLNGPMRPANRALVWSHSDLNSLFPGVFTTPFSAIMPCTISMIFNLGADNASIALTKGYVDFIRAGHNAMSIHLQCGGFVPFLHYTANKGVLSSAIQRSWKALFRPIVVRVKGCPSQYGHHCWIRFSLWAPTGVTHGAMLRPALRTRAHATPWRPHDMETLSALLTICEGNT